MSEPRRAGESSADYIARRTREIAEETASVETAEGRACARAALNASAKHLRSEIAALDAKRPFSKAKKVLAQQNAENYLRAKETLLAELEKPTSERDPVANLDLQSYFHACNSACRTHGPSR